MQIWGTDNRAENRNKVNAIRVNWKPPNESQTMP